MSPEPPVLRRIEALVSRVRSLLVQIAGLRTVSEPWTWRKDCSYRVWWSEEDGVWIAAAVDLNGAGLQAHGDTPEIALVELGEALSIAEW